MEVQPKQNAPENMPAEPTAAPAKDNKYPVPPEYGLITFGAAVFFRWLQKWPPQRFIGSRAEELEKIDFESMNPEKKKRVAGKRARKVDAYMLAWIGAEIIFFFIGKSDSGKICWVEWAIQIAIILRLVDILQVNVNLSLFDHNRTRKNANQMASVVRTVINVFVNYFEMILCFAVIYGFNAGKLSNIKDDFDALYFSLVSQVTLGFGDIMPLGYFKIITSIQFILGYFFTALIIGRFISLLPQGGSVAEGGGK